MKTPTLPITRGELRICRDLAELSRQAAALFGQLARRSVEERGRFTVALSGGSTPRPLYALLATPEFCERLPWAATHFFWGDERCVPPDDRESNYRMANETLLSHVPVPAGNIHPMRGEDDPQHAAADYERLLRSFFALAPGQLPRFDLVLMGMGEEGHTASLFPGSPALQERERLVVAPYVEKLSAHRITLTLPVFNAAASVVFEVAGGNKAAILRRVLQDDGNPPPAALVRPANGTQIWLVDEAAARLLV